AIPSIRCESGRTSEIAGESDRRGTHDLRRMRTPLSRAPRRCYALPALRPATALAQAEQHLAHLGADHRRPHPLYPREHIADHDDADAARFAGRYDHERRDFSLDERLVAARRARILREHHGAALEVDRTDRARDLGADEIALATGATDAPL